MISKSHSFAISKAETGNRIGALLLSVSIPKTNNFLRVRWKCSNFFFSDTHPHSISLLETYEQFGLISSSYPRLTATS